MDDLISRAALLKSLNGQAPKPTTDDLYTVNMCIINAPAVSAVPVVRCGDCKHRDPEDKKCDCGDMTVQGLYFPRPDTWYCPNGERRESE